MSREIRIGASISSRTDASAEVEKIFVESDFPLNLVIQNHIASRLVLPELKALDIAPMASQEATFTDLGLLKRVVSSVAQIARLHGYTRIATFYTMESPETVVSTSPQAETTTSAPADDGQVYAVLVEERDGGILLVAVGDVQFEIKYNQLREDGSLTAGGVTAYEAALASQNQ